MPSTCRHYANRCHSWARIDRGQTQLCLVMFAMENNIPSWENRKCVSNTQGQLVKQRLNELVAWLLWHGTYRLIGYVQMSTLTRHTFSCEQRVMADRLAFVRMVIKESSTDPFKQPCLLVNKRFKLSCLEKE